MPKQKPSKSELPDEKRAAIIEIAHRHFMAEGFVNAGMALIAREAEVSTATLYKMAPSKEILFAQVIEKACADQQVRIAAVTMPGKGDLRTRLRALIDNHIALMLASEQYRLLGRLLAVVPRFPELGALAYRTQFTVFYDNVAGHLQTLVDEGLLMPHDTHLAAHILGGMVRELYQLNYFFEGGPPDKQDAEKALDMVLHAFAARNGVAA